MVRLPDYEMQLLAEIKEAREKNNSLNSSYKSILSVPIRAIHKREVKS